RALARGALRNESTSAGRAPLLSNYCCGYVGVSDRSSSRWSRHQPALQSLRIYNRRERLMLTMDGPADDAS
ncbi:MAG: hypothetical protein ACT4PX_04780, partial [Actinomycetota bacterium]